MGSVASDTSLADRTLDPPVIVTCLKQRYSGVSGTINALLPIQARLRPLGYVGAALPGVDLAVRESPENFRNLTLRQAIGLSARPLPDGRPRLWHVRRNHEMLLGLVLRDGWQLPIRLIFTSAAIRRHSLLPRQLIRRMDAVIATTPDAARFLPATAGVVGHGVDTQRFHLPPSRDEAWATTGLPGKFGIGIFGRIRPEKGIHLFIQSLLRLLPRFPDFTAVVGGLCQPGDQPYLQGLQRELSAAGLGKRVIWLGEIPPAEMPAWYQRLLITVACPLYEGFGLTPIEAMASGSAVVATRTGAFASMVADGTTGRVVPVNDVPALTDSLAELMTDPGRTAGMGYLGRKRAVEQFSIEAEAGGIERIYESVWRRTERREPTEQSLAGINENQDTLG